jgi:hypothetical protein
MATKKTTGAPKEPVEQKKADPRSDEALVARRGQLERAQAEAWNRYQALGGAIQAIDELLRTPFKE